MKHTLMDRYVIDTANEIYEEYKKTTPNEHDLLMKLRSFAIIDYHSVQRTADRSGLKIPQTMRMLEAHGSSDEEKYSFTDLIDGKRIWTPVQEWIDQHDGKYDALYICVCNPANYQLPPAKSLLIYPATSMMGTEIFDEAQGNGHKMLNIIQPQSSERRHGASLLEKLIES